jgi:hypothetical protein
VSQVSEVFSYNEVSDRKHVSFSFIIDVAINTIFNQYVLLGRSPNER